MPENISKFDFHLHTCWSYDATAPVEYYFAAAEAAGMSHIAITEHHHMDSFAEVQEAAARHPGVAYIPAAELTVYTEVGTFDMVCLNLPVNPGKELLDVFEMYHQWQRDCGDASSYAFTTAGFPYTKEDRLMLLQRYRPQKAIDVQGITHVQGGLQRDYLLNEKGYFKDADTMYDLRMKYPVVHYPEAEKVIPAVKRAGGLVFIAHPQGYFNGKDLKRIEELRERLDFDGIECAHTSVDAEHRAFYREYCLKNGLLSTAGSDVHCAPGDKYKWGEKCKLGVHGGEERYLEEILERVQCFRGDK